MYKVRLYLENGSVEEYNAASLQYAKRYADLYKTDFKFTEIVLIENGQERVIETFGSRA